MGCSLPKSLIGLSLAVVIAGCSPQPGQSTSEVTPIPSNTVSATVPACTAAELMEPVKQFFTLWNSGRVGDLTNLLTPDVGATISTQYQQGDNTPSVSGRQLSIQLITQQEAAGERLSYDLIETPAVTQYTVNAFVKGVRGSFPDGRILTYSDAQFGYDCRSSGLYNVLLWAASAPAKP